MVMAIADLLKTFSESIKELYKLFDESSYVRYFIFYIIDIFIESSFASFTLEFMGEFSILFY